MALAPIDTTPLFAPLHAELMGVLRSLDAAAWLRPTVAGRWLVRDVAAHLLDVDLRKVAVSRDGHFVPTAAPIESPADVAQLVNRLNAEGVAYAARLSPRLITELLAVSGEWVTALVTSLPPHGRSVFAVSWAGETESENWMDTGREYTERWHHQMQIRDAVGQPLLLDERWLTPLLDISVRVLPLALADLDATDGSSLLLCVNDDVRTTWTLARLDGRWHLDRGTGGRSPDTIVRMSGDTAWRLFYNALTPARVAERVAVDGDAALAAPLLGARSIVM